MSPKQVNVGVFVAGETMILDTAAVDILGMGSKEFIASVPFLPDDLKDLAPVVSVSYIASGELIPMTAGATMRVTHDLSHPDVQPGKLDVLLVPGVPPDAQLDEEALDVLRGHAESPGTDILSICTGIVVCCAAGITEGKTACGPRDMQDLLREKYPGTKFVGDKCRWTQDGNLWTSGMFCAT